MGEQVGIAALPEADGDIGIAALQIDQLERGVDQHVDAGLGAAELLQPRHQPSGGKGGLHRENEAAAGARTHGLYRRGDLGEGGRKLAQTGRAGRCQRQGAPMPHQQPLAQGLLQLGDKLLHRAGADVQLLGGAAVVEVPRGGFEGPQGVEGRQRRGHQEFRLSELPA